MKKLLFLCVLSIVFISCKSVQQGIKADLIGFSDDVSLSYEKHVPSSSVVKVGRHNPPYEISTEKETGYKQMRSEIYKMSPISANTSLYFAKDVARKRIRYLRHHELNRDTKIFVLIMTDGLENTSLRAAKNHHMGHCCKTTEKYERVTKKIMPRAMGKNNWQVYPIVFEGDDLEKLRQTNNMSSTDWDEFLTKQFEPLRGAKGAPVKPKKDKEDRISPRVIHASSASDLATYFKEQFFSASFGFHIPKGYAGKSIKMKITDTAGVTVEFTGDFMKKGSNYIFKNVKSSSELQYLSPKRGVWKATNKKNRKELVAWFAFNDFKINEKAVTDYSVSQRVEQQGIWVENTEYEKQAALSENVYIIAILDGSESVGEDYNEMKKALLDMIDIVTGRK